MRFPFTTMFSSLPGLFQTVPCPDKVCSRTRCLFSHTISQAQNPLKIQVEMQRTIPTKRPEHPSPSSTPSSSASTSRLLNSTQEPPRKLQKLSQKPPVTSATHIHTGIPILKVNAAQSQVPVPVRQAMLKSLYEHFDILYQGIRVKNPTLAAEHALKQEEEIYKTSNKHTYRNAIKLSIAVIKRREIPTSSEHDSVGTEGDLAARAAARKSMDALRLNIDHLEPLVMSMASMRQWAYIVQIPEGPGGQEPSLENKIAKCERCSIPFQVKRMSEADECVHHWGKPLTKNINGERTRAFACCSRLTTDGEGCVRGHHVFYEREDKDLHARHAFSFTRPGLEDRAKDTAFQFLVLDCEMIYTTQGMSVARVSVIDGEAKTVYDELVKLDEGVEVIDYNTRFSGITAENHSKAVLSLTAIRKSLDSFISSETILIGHALDNDLKTLRMIHHRCIDTAILLPHRLGPPYRRSLKDLVKEHLGKSIQTGGGTTGHSSVEDCAATLNLVRWIVLNQGV